MKLWDNRALQPILQLVKKKKKKKSDTRQGKTFAAAKRRRFEKFDVRIGRQPMIRLKQSGLSTLKLPLVIEDASLGCFACVKHG